MINFHYFSFLFIYKYYRRRVECLLCHIWLIPYLILSTKYNTIFFYFRKMAERALRVFDTLMNFLLPEMFTTVLQSIFTFFNEANIWEWELLSIDLMKSFMWISEDSVSIMHNFLGRLLMNHIQIRL